MSEKRRSYDKEFKLSAVKQEELRKKDREIARLKMERDILKKAISYFAKVKD